MFHIGWYLFLSVLIISVKLVVILSTSGATSSMSFFKFLDAKRLENAAFFLIQLTFSWKFSS